ncbi:PilZ domain-containing protein [Alteromonas oceanisediminis]|uniref:PilZ domain-containing protein n=1 Tax=Alteromonas oceanisediminis TaxID=2836180 RepID=UPI001BD99C1E|nr:PilZ domain-containing protein [Alteromonas oceanisediminis]MBT0585808.1 PilZ domain-containing protein [Alteromonas oceanisediminis]
MTQDIHEYHDLIERLKPMINEPEFNQVLNQVASHLSRDRRFLLKMELKRLARPCIRVIDLRGKVDGECRLYEHDGRNHYLDDIAIETFEKQLRLFGEYTLGVYEAVHRTENNLQLMRKALETQPDSTTNETTEQDPLTRFSIPTTTLLDYPKRDNERMNYAVALELFTEHNNSVMATSMDISRTGMRVKLNSNYLFKPGEKLSVYFRGMEAEYALDKKQGIEYQILDIERIDREQRLRLVRAEDDVNPAFDHFLEKFIHGNKRRYKVNMDNTVDAIKSKTCEQFYTPRFPSLPVFIDLVDEQYIPRYAMVNDANRQILQYWQDETDAQRIGFMLNHERIAQMARMPHEQREMFVYVFTHVKDAKVYFYSATRQELNSEPDVSSVYLGFGSRKVSWRVFKLQLTDMTPEQAYSPLSIPDSVSDTVKRQNHPPTPRLMARLKHLKHILLVTDITSELGQQRYEKHGVKRSELVKLKRFGHPRNKLPELVKVFRFKYLEQRLENRYQLRSKVSLRFEDMELEGVSEDVSVQGLRLELDSFFHGPVNSRVTIAFPQLQKITKKYKLVNLQYRVVNISADRNVLHLKVINESGNVAKQFFEDLIKHNRNRLKTYPDEEEIPGIGHALRCIYAKNVANIAFFIRKDNGRFVPDNVINYGQNTRLARLGQQFAEPGEFNLEFLYRDRTRQYAFIQEALKQLKVEPNPLERELFIAFDPSQEDFNEAIKPRFAEQFLDHEERRTFISTAMKNGQFIAVYVYVSLTGRPDLDTLQSEINYVSVYAIHRAKELEEQLWNVYAMGNLIDITDDVLHRYNIPDEQIAANHQVPHSHVVGTDNIEALLKH